MRKCFQHAELHSSAFQRDAGRVEEEKEQIHSSASDASLGTSPRDEDRERERARVRVSAAERGSE